LFCAILSTTGDEERRLKALHMQVEEFKSLLAAHASGVIIGDRKIAFLKSVKPFPGALGWWMFYSIMAASSFES